MHFLSSSLPHTRVKLFLSHSAQDSMQLGLKHAPQFFSDFCGYFSPNSLTFLWFESYFSGPWFIYFISFWPLIDSEFSFTLLVRILLFHLSVFSFLRYLGGLLKKRLCFGISGSLRVDLLFTYCKSSFESMYSNISS